METIKLWFIGGLRYIIFYLDDVIYGFIIKLYNIFRWICGARVMDSTIINELATRVGFILGLIMFFYISFDFIQILIDPDKLNDKEKGPLNIIKKFLIVIVLLGTSRFIFDLMYRFQTIVLSDDNGKGSIIEKLVLPYAVNTSSFGNAIAFNFMKEFYKVTPIVQYEINDEGTAVNILNSSIDDEKMDNFKPSECALYTELLYTSIAEDGDFSIGYECVRESFKTTREYSWMETHLAGKTNSADSYEWFVDLSFWSLPIGIFMIWILIVYCVSVGMRVVQLAILQIIAPAAIICYLSPNKENTFTKWLKLYFSTYIDVFIRIAIIDFGVLICGLILEQSSLVSDGSVTLTSGMYFWAKVFMIMAVLSIVKKMPELLKKLLPDKLQSGLDFGFGTKERPGMGLLAGTALGTTIGLVGGVTNGEGFWGKVGGAVTGAVGGLGRGAINANKGQNLRESLANARKAQVSHNAEVKAVRNAGGTWIGHLANTAATNLGLPSSAAVYEGQIKGIEREIENTKEQVAPQRRKSTVHKRVQELKGQMEERAVDKLLNGDLSGKNATLRAEASRVRQAKAHYESLVHSGAPKADIDAAQTAYNATLEDAKHKYISTVFDDALHGNGKQDAKMANMFRDLQNLGSTDTDGALAGMAHSLSGVVDWKTLDDFEIESTGRNNDINREIAANDAQVAKLEGQIATIKQSTGYRRAEAEKPKNGN